MNVQLCEWQKFDPDNGLVMPWLSHGALAEIKEWDLSGKNVLQFGSGMGDAWLGRRCKKLVSIERSEEWLIKVSEYVATNAVGNVQYFHRPCCEGDSAEVAAQYTKIPEGFEPDIIINDDVFRTEVCEMAVEYFKGRGGGILICDNYWQDYVWKSPKAMELLEPFRKNVHVQEGHTNHEGNPYKTAIIFIEDKEPEEKINQVRGSVDGIDVPKEWMPTNDYDSHRPMLYLILSNTKGDVIELGSGEGSTPLIRKFCEQAGRNFYSYESNQDWCNKTGSQHINGWDSDTVWQREASVAFVDHAPGEHRAVAIKKLKDICDYIIVHDSQDSADHVYGLSKVLSKFRYRLDLTPERLPHTTCVSNIHNPNQCINRRK